MPGGPTGGGVVGSYNFAYSLKTGVRTVRGRVTPPIVQGMTEREPRVPFSGTILPVKSVGPRVVTTPDGTGYPLCF